MKVIRNIILVLLFITFVAICLYIAPNYKKTGYEDKTNLVINYTNVTAKMKGKIIREGNEIYLSIDDIKNYYDKNIYIDEKYNVVVVAKDKYYACFDIKNNTLELNDKKSTKKIIKEDNLYYVPITSLQEAYNIEVKYNEVTDCVVIKSLDRDIKTGVTTSKVAVKSKPNLFSRTIERIDGNAKVYIKIEDEPKKVDNSINKKPSKSILDKATKYLNEFEENIAKDWIYVRTENGTLGYIPSKSIKDINVSEYKTQVNNKKISLVWDFYDSKYGKVPKVEADTKYNGVTAVSPTCFFMREDIVNEKVGEDGEKYFAWAKENNYMLWPRLANESTTAEDMKAFSNWITDYKKRQDVINQIVNYVDKYNLDGINLDFESMYKEDVDCLSRFIIELKPRLAQRNAILSVDVTEPDGSDTWSLCYDRRVIGEVADYIVFMAYDQTSGKAKEPGSNAAYYWVERNVKKFINNEGVNPNKIILGIPFYSKLWKINSNGQIEKSYNIAMKDQQKHVDRATTKEWLKDSKQNYIEYVSNDGYTYKMWVEDVKSITEKLNLINEYNLAGAGFWQNGNEDKEIWDVVTKKILK
ncbi:MAG: hypothetical protein J6J36_06165 [Clostridia bacterium]|nr:hypothetical protein [Clostridia bacterium]